jgi:hypothetical protein
MRKRQNRERFAVERRGEKRNAHIGVTPTKGADTPAYKPRASPSFATLFLTTSSALLYTPFSAVCSLTFTRSNGCPTMTAHTPPNPPAARLRRPESDDLAAAWTSSFSSGSVSGTCGRVEETGSGRWETAALSLAPGEEGEGDMVGCCAGVVYNFLLVSCYRRFDKKIDEGKYVQESN